MAGGHHTHRPLTVPFLVIKEQVRAKGLQKFGLVQTAQKQRLVQTNIPLTQGANYPFMGRRAAGCYQCRADRTLLVGELGLNTVERCKKRLARGI